MSLKTPGVPIVVVLKAMGVQSDQEIVSLIGSEPEISDELPASFEQVNIN